MDIFPVMMDVFSRMTVLFFHAGQISSHVEQKWENDGPTVENAGHSHGTPEGFLPNPFPQAKENKRPPSPSVLPGNPALFEKSLAEEIRSFEPSGSNVIITIRFHVPKEVNMMAVKLFEPYTVKNVTFPNRIVMSPMCMYSCFEEDGKPGDFHFTHYTSRAVGKVGLIILEATGVLPEGRISDRDLGIWSDAHIEGLAKLVSAIKQYGAKAGIQLAHAGRKARVKNGDIFAPSPLRFSDEYKLPKEMTRDDIRRTVKAFKDAAERAKKSGFDVIEIHAAHGYLINQFLSPLTNQRKDAYGGTAENRCRLLFEIIGEVKTVWDGPLFVRISASDHHAGGLVADDYVEIAKQLKKLGVDLIDVSSGGVVPDAQFRVYPGYQVPFAEKIKREADIPVGAVGLITSPLQAEEILQNGRADLIFLGRELLRNPYWPYHAAKELGHPLEAPEQYRRGWI